MKKKIFLIAAMCFMLLGLAACSQTDPASVDYNGYSYEDLKSNCQGTVQTLMYLGEEDKYSFPRTTWVICMGMRLPT